MTKKEAISRWRGAFLPVLTIFKDNLQLDEKATADNVRALVKRGAKTGNTVFLAVGAGGEFPVLTVDERKAAAKAIVDAAGGKAPVIVGCQDNSTAVSVELAQYATEIGAEGIQMSPTNYYHPSDEDVYRHIKAVNDAADIGIMVYNTWWHGYEIPLDLMERLVRLRNVLSIKWSSASPYFYKAGYSRFAHRVAMVDNSGMAVSAHMRGATGFITHLANFWPESDWRLWELCEEGRHAEAHKHTVSVNEPWYGFRVKMGEVTGGEANVVKAALDLCGMKGGPVRPPTQDMKASHRKELKALLTKIGTPVK